MPHYQVTRQMNRIEKKLDSIEKRVEMEFESIDSKIRSFKENDIFDKFVELFMLFSTSLKLIILGTAIVIPWSSIRDLWVKISMGIFLVKSSKRIKKVFQKGRKGRKEEDSQGSVSNEPIEEIIEEDNSSKSKERQLKN